MKLCRIIHRLLWWRNWQQHPTAPEICKNLPRISLKWFLRNRGKELDIAKTLIKMRFLIHHYHSRIIISKRDHREQISFCAQNRKKVWKHSVRNFFQVFSAFRQNWCATIKISKWPSQNSAVLVHLKIQNCQYFVEIKYVQCQKTKPQVDSANFVARDKQ